MRRPPRTRAQRPVAKAFPRTLPPLRPTRHGGTLRVDSKQYQSARAWRPQREHPLQAAAGRSQHRSPLPAVDYQRPERPARTKPASQPPHSSPEGPCGAAALTTSASPRRRTSSRSDAQVSKPLLPSTALCATHGASSGPWTSLLLSTSRGRPGCCQRRLPRPLARGSPRCR